MRQYGNTVLVADGSAGFELELARALAVSGNHVIVSSADRQQLGSVRNRLPQIRTYHADVSDPAGRTALFELLIRDHPNLNVLVNGQRLCSCVHRSGEPEAVSNVVATEFLTYFRNKRDKAVLNVCGARLARDCPHTAKLKSLVKAEASVIEIVPPTRFSRLLRRLLVPITRVPESRDARSIVEALANGKARVLGEWDSRYFYKPASFFEDWLPSRVPAVPRT